MRWIFVVLIGVAAYLVTREVIVGVLAAAVGFWLLRSLRPAPTPTRYGAEHRPTASGSFGRGARADEGIAVVCKQVTPERQEWASVKTGRLFDVLSPDGPPDAQPGDPGEVIVQGTRYLVRTPLDPG